MAWRNNVNPLHSEMYRRLYEENYGADVGPFPCNPILHRVDFEPRIEPPALVRDFSCTIQDDSDKLQIIINVQHFKPEEISVKTVNGFIVVEAKHEEKKDIQGFITRHFIRRYELPVGCNAETVKSSLSSDGMLTVTAPRNVLQVIKGERQVMIVQTGRVSEINKSRINPMETKM